MRIDNNIRASDAMLQTQAGHASEASCSYTTTTATPKEQKYGQRERG